MRRDPHIPEGSTFQDVVRIAGLEEPEYAAACHHLTDKAVGALSIAYAVAVRSRIHSWGGDIPEGLSGGALLKWAIGRSAGVGPMPFSHLRDVCEAFAKQTPEEQIWLCWFWLSGSKPSFTAPDHVSGCSSCHRLFFHSDVRRSVCEQCHRRKHRDLMRNQRGTDLSERLCVVCGAAFSPKRTDAKCCSGKCRAKLSRQKPAAAEPAAVEPEVVVRRKAPSPAMRKVAAEMLRGFAKCQREDADSNSPETAATGRREAQRAELAAVKLEHPRQRLENPGLVPHLLLKRAEDAEGQAEGLLGEDSIGDTFKGPPTDAEAKQAKALLAEAKAYRACAEWLLGC
jgi:hypothetical protein